MSADFTRFALRMRGITKYFEGVAALADVSLEVLPGEVHALLGENGAGKSTLMSIAAGDLAPDAGTVEIGDATLGVASPTAAKHLGIGVVYQHPAIMPDLSVWENLILAVPSELRPPAGRSLEWTRERLREIGSDIDPARLGSSLSPVERTMVEIAKALAVAPKVLLLDEPTAVMGAEQVEKLFGQIREIRDRGTAIVYISHRIPEIREIADRVTILRDGRNQGTFPVLEVEDEAMLRLIAGRELSAIFPPKATSLGETVLRCQDLSGSHIEGVSLEVRAGEILGFGGAEGNGQVETIRSLAGLTSCSGVISVGGRDLASPRARILRNLGVLYIPGDREGEGVFPFISVRKNATAQTLGNYSRGGIMSPALEAAATGKALAALAVKTPSPRTEIQKLSGGNQQKVVLSRSLLGNPRVLLCEEPTQGVDVQTRAEIHRTLRELADGGSAVVVVSSDASELAGLCDRVAIFSRGQVTSELEGDRVTEAAIVAAAVTSTRTRRLEGASQAGVKLRRRILTLARGSWAAPVTLGVLALVVAAYTAHGSQTFLGSYNLKTELFQVAILVLVALGQLLVVLTGGVDLSVGPLMAVTVVALSFFESSGQGAGMAILGIVLVLAIGVLTGIGHTLMIRMLKLPPIIVTVITYIGFQGVALVLRSTPGGTASAGLVSGVESSLGFLPLAFLVSVAVALAAQRFLTHSRPGIAIRGVGSNEQSAHRVGVNVGRTVLLAYVGCSVFAVVAGILLYTQVGIGDPTVGISYSLQSVAAVVLGGASIYGGRGSFLGTAIGALLLTEIIGALPFLNLSEAWQYWFPGVLILVAGAFFARTFGSAKAT